MRNSEVIVVGAGIAGLTSAAILSKQGLSVNLIESHTQSGGCAGTFKRKNYIFDVGATQVAGLEKGGIHSRIFDFLDIQNILQIERIRSVDAIGIEPQHFPILFLNLQWW